MKIEVSETSAVIVLDQDDKGSKFQLFLPGELSYEDAPANAKMAVLLCSLLGSDDPAFTSLVLSKGKAEYDRYFTNAVKCDS